MIAFIAATLVFVFIGSNPIMSVGADSTIAPLFAVALLRLAPFSSTLYLELAATTAVITGLVVMSVGLLRLGWIADFLSLPIVTGFLGGIGVIIIVHQLPSALGVSAGGTSVLQRLAALSHVFGHVSAWSVKELGAVSAALPSWRLHWLSASQWGVVLTTAVTLVIVIVSQTAATSRTSSDDLGVESDISRDFVGVGLANVAAGLAGAFPVNASPARTTVSRLAGGRTKVVGLTAAVLAIALSPLAHFAHTIPLAALAGVLFFIGSRLIKVGQLAKIWRSRRLEFMLAMISLLGVIFIGVEQGLAIAVGLAILDQTWRSSRPHLIVLGRHTGTTSWEPLSEKDVASVDHVIAVLFDNDLFFANAGIFRRETHQLLKTYPTTRHLVIDAVAVSDIDFTGMTILGQVVNDLAKDKISITFARVSDGVRASLAGSFDKAVREIAIYDNVDAAVMSVAS
jgi:MFS superfamily sulfate permease-like transporter